MEHGKRRILSRSYLCRFGLCIFLIYIACILSITLSQVYLSEYLKNTEEELPDVRQQDELSSYNTRRNYIKENGSEDVLSAQKFTDDDSNDGKHLDIECLSARDRVLVSLDDKIVYQKTKNDANLRGIHVIVINQNKGVIMTTAVFDTFSADHGDIVKFLYSIQNGRLVVLLVGDDGGFKLKYSTRDSITSLGSQFINRLRYRHVWAFICQKGSSALTENHSANEKLVTVNIRFKLEKKSICEWENDSKWSERSEFCSKYDGFDDLCQCVEPMSLDVKSIPLPGSRLGDIPIAVIASNRPRYLFRMLRSLLAAPGVNREMITVYIDGQYDAPAALTSLFHLNYVRHTEVKCNDACQVSHHYKLSLSHTFEKHKNAKYVIIFEDDLDVSRDIMDYFSQLLPILESDESVYCISAWNDHGFSSYNPETLYRVETMPGLGWVLKRKLFVEELAPKWPEYVSNWDVWIRQDDIRKGRECIIPEVSRTFHFGVSGINMNPMVHKMFYERRVLNKKTGIEFNIDVMKKNNHELELHRLIRSSHVLNHSMNPCDDDFVPKTTHRSYVIYIGDASTWLRIAKCFQIWYYDIRGLHKEMIRFSYQNNSFFVVGMASPYSVHKPEYVSPIIIKSN